MSGYFFCLVQSESGREKGLLKKVSTVSLDKDNTSGVADNDNYTLKDVLTTSILRLQNTAIANLCFLLFRVVHILTLESKVQKKLQKPGLLPQNHKQMPA